MKKYGFYMIPDTEKMWVEYKADNLEEAIRKANAEFYDHKIEETTEIEIDKKLLEDDGGQMLLCDIAPADYNKY